MQLSSICLGAKALLILLLGVALITNDHRLSVWAANSSSKIPPGEQVSPPQSRIAAAVATGRLVKDSRAQLAKARANGARSMTLLLAAKDRETAITAQTVTRLGGYVQVQDSAVDYLCVVVPIEQVEAVAALSSVDAADVNKGIEGLSNFHYPGFKKHYPSDPRSSVRAASEFTSNHSAPDTAWPPPPSDYPFRHPYIPLADLAAGDWRAQHPTWDGRGVTIADFEVAPDVLAPELQEGLTIDGQRVRKFVDIITNVEPAVDAPLEGQTLTDLWVWMRDIVEAQQLRINFKGETYTAPYNGRFRIGVQNMNEIDWGDLGKPFNPNQWGDDAPTGTGSPFGVLWDESTNTVWVDTNQNRDFRDEHPLTDYNARGDVGVFGTDDPTTPVRESVGFAIRTDRAHHAIALLLGTGAHSTMVMSSAAGRSGRQGFVDGVAPGARLMAVGVDFTWANLIERYIRLFSDPRVDIVLIESAPPGTGLRDGSSVANRILQRLINLTKKVAINTNGNGTSLGTSEDKAMARSALAIGAYQSGESYRVNRSAITRERDNLHIVNSGGPAGNGAIKPDLLAPSGHLAIAPGWRGDEWRLVNDLFRLPIGYTIGGGSSQAAPTAAGAVALLISAAKQEGIPYDAPRIRQALLSSARYLPNIPQYQQGHGLIQVAAAWEELKRLSHESELIQIESTASVRTQSSRWLTPPNAGPGLFELEGWKAGQREERIITFTRTSGPAAAMPFEVRWVGNDGTFQSDSMVTLPLNQAVAVTVTVAPTTAGDHSALLELARPGEKAWVHSVACTIVASYHFNEPDYTLTLKDTMPRPALRSIFLTVPPGSGALELEFAGQESFYVELIKPDGESAGWHKIDFQIGSSRVRKREIRKVIPSPEAGVWTIGLNGSYDQKFYNSAHPTLPVEEIPFILKASVLGVNVTPAQISEAPPPNARIAIAVENKFASFTGSLTPTAIASGMQTTITLSHREQRVYSLTVPEGSTQVLGRVRVSDGSKSDVDIYLFDCTDGNTCKPINPRNANMDGDETIMVSNPKAGNWKFVVDAADAPSGSVAVEYTDLVLNPRYGTAAVADIIQVRKTNATWIAPMYIWNASQVPPPRRPFALLRVDDTAIETPGDVSDPPPNRLPLGWTAIPLTGGP